jgi:hypothetical protein
MASVDVGAGSTGAVVLVGAFQVSALLDFVGLLYMVGEWACCLHRGLKWGLGTGASEISERSLRFGRLTSTWSWTTVISMICRTGFLDVWCSKGHGDVSVIKGFSS